MTHVMQYTTIFLVTNSSPNTSITGSRHSSAILSLLAGPKRKFSNLLLPSPPEKKNQCLICAQSKTRHYSFIAMWGGGGVVLIFYFNCPRFQLINEYNFGKSVITRISFNIRQRLKTFSIIKAIVIICLDCRKTLSIFF